MTVKEALVELGNTELLVLVQVAERAAESALRQFTAAACVAVVLVLSVAGWIWWKERRGR